MTNKTAIFITGDQGTGKTALARTLAESLGTFETIDYENMNFGPRYGGRGWNEIIKTSPDTVIVEGVKNHPSMFDFLRPLISNETMQLELKCKDPTIIKTPNFIFVSQDPKPIKIPEDDLRFYVIKVKGPKIENVMTSTPPWVHPRNSRNIKNPLSPRAVLKPSNSRR